MKRDAILPDVIIRVRFRTKAEGGRQNDIIIPDCPEHHYGCPLIVEGEAFDCRVLVTSKTFRLGMSYELPIKFINPNLVLPRLSSGTAVKLWEGKEIASGEVVRIVECLPGAR